MKNITNKIKKAGIGFGLLTLAYTPLMSREKPVSVRTIKVGVTYNIVQTNKLSKNCFGIESLVEKKLKRRLFAEWEMGMYADTRKNAKITYSKMQTNIGLKYKPIMKNGWAMGGKLALGVSSEFYKEKENIITLEKKSLNKLVGLDVEKVFKNGVGINFGISKDINKNVWRLGIKLIFNPERQRSYSNRKSFPWPDF